MFKFKFKKSKSLFWKSLSVEGFSYDGNTDKMCLDLGSKGILEIPEWRLHYCELGQDFKEFREKNKPTEQ